eukprot:33035_1
MVVSVQDHPEVMAQQTKSNSVQLPVGEAGGFVLPTVTATPSLHGFKDATSAKFRDLRESVFVHGAEGRVQARALFDKASVAAKKGFAYARAQPIRAMVQLTAGAALSVIGCNVAIILAAMLLFMAGATAGICFAIFSAFLVLMVMVVSLDFPSNLFPSAFISPGPSFSRW